MPTIRRVLCAILRAMTTLDATDAKLLLALTQTPRASGVELAQRLGLSRNTVQARLTRWDQHEALAGIDHQIVPRAMGYPMTAYVTARIDQHQLEAIGAALADVPEVVQVHGLAGADDLMIKVVAVDSDDLYRIAGNILDIPVLPDVDRHRHARAGCVPDDAAAAAPLRAGIGPSPASPEPLRPSRIAAYCPKARQ